MHTVVHFFLQIRAPHVLYARRNSHAATRSGSDQRPPACAAQGRVVGEESDEVSCDEQGKQWNWKMYQYRMDRFHEISLLPESS
jgi:hypothetical protein